MVCLSVRLAVFAFVMIVDGSLQGGDKDKITIKVVMKKAMAGGLCKKVASGEGTKEDQSRARQAVRRPGQVRTAEGRSRGLEDQDRSARQGRQGRRRRSPQEGRQLHTLATRNTRARSSNFCRSRFR